MFQATTAACLFLTALIPVGFAVRGETATTTSTAIVRTNLNEKQFEGAITGWRVDKKGSVYFRLSSGNANSKNKDLWFITPPNQTARTELERLVLEIVLSHLTSKKNEDAAGAKRIRVLGDTSTDRGKTRDDAIEMVAIERLGQGVPRKTASFRESQYGYGVRASLGLIQPLLAHNSNCHSHAL